MRVFSPHRQKYDFKHAGSVLPMFMAADAVLRKHTDVGEYSQRI
jgi:hypothetical protein